MSRKRAYESIEISTHLEKKNVTTNNLPTQRPEDILEDDNQNNADVPSSISYLEPLLHPLRDLTENWNVDLCRSLQAYLHDIDDNRANIMANITFSPQHEIGVPTIGSSFNFAQAALVIQGSSLIYSKKVEYFYALVRQFLDRHTRLYAQSGKIINLENDDYANDNDSITKDVSQTQNNDTHMLKAREACSDDERELLKRSMNPGSGQNITTLDNTFAVSDSINDRSHPSTTNHASDSTMDQSTDIFLFQTLFDSKSVLEYDDDGNLEALGLLHDTLPDAGLPPMDPLFLIPDIGENEDDGHKNKDANGKKKSQQTTKHRRTLLKNVLAHISKLFDSSDNIIGEKYDFFINRTMLNDTGWLLLEQNLPVMMSTPISDANQLQSSQEFNVSYQCLDEPPALDQIDTTLDVAPPKDMECPLELEGHKDMPIPVANPEWSSHCSEDEGIELADSPVNAIAEEGHDVITRTQPHFDTSISQPQSITPRKFAALKATNSPNVKLGSNDVIWDLMDPYEVLNTENALDKNTGQFDYRKVTKKALTRETYLRSRYQHSLSPPAFHVTHTAYDTYKQLLAFVSHHQQHAITDPILCLNFPEFNQFYRDLSSATAHHQSNPSHPAKKGRAPLPPIQATAQIPSPAHYPEPLSSREGSPASPSHHLDTFDTFPVGSPLGDFFDEPRELQNNNLTFFALDDGNEIEAGNGTLRARQVMGTRCKDYLERARVSALAGEGGSSAASYDAWETFIKTRVLAQHPADFMGPFADARTSQASQKGRKRQRLLHDKLRYDIIADQESVFAALENTTTCMVANEISFAQVVQYSQKSRCDPSSSSSILNNECHLGLPKLIPRLFFACLLLANSGNVDIDHHDDSMTGKFTITLKSLVRNYEKLKEQLDL